MKSLTCDWVGNQNFVVINVQAHFLLPATEAKAHDRIAAREYNCRKVGTSPLLGISPWSQPSNCGECLNLLQLPIEPLELNELPSISGAWEKSRQKKLLQLPFAFCLARVANQHRQGTCSEMSYLSCNYLLVAQTTNRMLSEQSTFPTDMVSRSYCMAKCGSVLAKPTSQLTQTRKNSESSEVFFRTVIEYVWLKDQIKSVEMMNSDILMIYWWML